MIWNEEAQKNEIFEREHDDYVLYTITPRMEGVYSIADVRAKPGLYAMIANKLKITAINIFIKQIVNG